MKYIVTFIAVIMALLLVNTAFSNFNGRTNDRDEVVRYHGISGCW